MLEILEDLDEEFQVDIGAVINSRTAKLRLRAEEANVNFSWMAIATRKGADQITHAHEILEKDFDQKMNGVMFNDNDTITTPQHLWWDGQQIRFDKPASKK